MEVVDVAVDDPYLGGVMWSLYQGEVEYNMVAYDAAVFTRRSSEQCAARWWRSTRLGAPWWRYVRNQVIYSLVWCCWVIDLCWFEFESSKLRWFYPTFIFVLCGESRLLVSWCAGDRCDMMSSDENRGRSRRPGAERTGDGQAQGEYSVARRSRGRVTLCVICTVHK
jgi:hypothetical protein